MATTYFTASSADGFIADPANSLSWLLSRDVDVRGPMGYERFVEESVGALVMGSTTYDWLLDEQLEGDLSRPWPYDLPSWVFSTREPRRVGGDVRFVRGPVDALHAEMTASAGDRDLWVVGGGDLAGQFADAGLLDEVWVQYAPVSLGAGAPLLPRRIELRLEEVERNRDFACARWSVLRRAAAPPSTVSTSEEEVAAVRTSLHLSEVVTRSADEVHAYASDPRTLPEWAAGLAGSIAHEDGQWVAQSPMGRVVVEPAPANPFGVLDHVVVLPSGERVHNPMRVIPLGDACEVVFTLRRRPGMSDEDVELDASAVRADLATLRRLLEARS